MYLIKRIIPLLLLLYFPIHLPHLAHATPETPLALAIATPTEPFPLIPVRKALAKLLISPKTPDTRFRMRLISLAPPVTR